MSILAYVSGHGFGHWTRSEALLERLAVGAPVHVRTSGRALLLARRAAWPASVEERDVGPGVAQRGPLAVDVPATRAALAAHLAAWDDLLSAAEEEGRALGVRGVYADAPPVAFEVARRLGVPSVAVANFSWSWAYEHYADQDPFFTQAAARLRAAEGLATALVPLPGGGGLRAFCPDPGPALVLRRPPTCEPAEARRRLRALAGSGDRPTALISFGGYGEELDLSAAAARTPDWSFLCFAPPAGPRPANLSVLPADHGLPHQDLVLGADALVAKPGYGTVTECLAGPTPMVYVSPGGGFREHARLVTAIERWLPCARLSIDDLLAGAWGPALARARAARPREAPPAGGLAEALDLVGHVLGLSDLATGPRSS